MPWHSELLDMNFQEIRGMERHAKETSPDHATNHDFRFRRSGLSRSQLSLNGRHSLTGHHAPLEHDYLSLEE